MNRRILVIANPIAGGGRARTLTPRLAAALQALGCTTEVHFTAQAGDAQRRALIAGPEPWDALVAVGGDGTINEVLNGMPDPGRPLGVLPLGTANVLAVEYRLPRRAEAAAAVIAAGRTRHHAIGVAAGRRFLLFCGVGVDGAVVQRLHERRSGTLGKHKWLAPIWDVTRRWPCFRLRATIGDGEVIDDCSSVLVTRVRNYGGVLSLPREVEARSGLLHVLCFRQKSRLAWIGQGALGFLRCMHAGRNLLLRATSRVRIDGNAAPYQVDGDFGGIAPVDVHLHGTPAKLLVP